MGWALKRWSRAVVYLVLTDVAAVFGAFGVAMRLRFRPFINVIEIREGYLLPEVALVALFAAVGVPLVFRAYRLYQRRVWLSRSWTAVQLVKAIGVLLGAYLILQYLTKSSLFVESRLVILMWGGLTLLATGANRLLVFPALLAFAARGALHRRIALVGVNESSIAFARRVRQEKHRVFLNVVGFIDEHRKPGEEVADSLPVLGSLHQLERLVDLYNLEGAVLIADETTPEALLDAIERCVHVFGWVDVHTDRTRPLASRLDPDTYFDIPFLRMRSIQSGPVVLLQKRLFDVVASALAIVVLSPLLLAIALAVRLSSPGPILYVSERVGMNGRPFRFYKFRSMYVGADRDMTRTAKLAEGYANPDKPMPTKLVNASMVTPVGRFLRKWALDELPQLFNVLRGDMSLVGPRPLPPSEYNLQNEWQKTRFRVKPGCTGLWKVHAAHDPTMPYSTSILYDIYYARNANLLLDLAILWKTAWVILSGRADGPVPSSDSSPPTVTPAAVAGSPTPPPAEPRHRQS
ncbi:MAG: sugar transferase [Kiritimatiellae bacterium]|nr:sugar transferase [Kiritimatiellia bacterium]